MFNLEEPLLRLCFRDWRRDPWYNAEGGSKKIKDIPHFPYQCQHRLDEVSAYSSAAELWAFPPIFRPLTKVAASYSLKCCSSRILALRLIYCRP
jgi:hypothetical protein